MKAVRLQASDPLQQIAQESADVAPAADSVEEGRGWQRAYVVAVGVLVIMLFVGPLTLPPRMPNDHYVYLAQNLVQGRLTVDDLPGSYPDQIQLAGHKYLPLGPLPGLLLIPFLPLLESGVRLLWVGYLFTAFNVWLFYRVLGLAGITGDRRRWALLLFFGGTVYFSMAIVGASYFFAHIVTVTFVLLAVSEALGKRRRWLVGLFLGLAAMTRFTALFSIPFFLWLMWEDTRRESRYEESDVAASDPRRRSLRQFLSGVGFLLVGLVGPLSLLLLYNYLRFGKPLETGYSFALLGVEATRQARSYGLFSIVHIPKNLFMMLLQGPLPWPNADAPVLQFPYVWPSPWGMGLFFTSPALIFAFRHFRAGLAAPLVRACWLAILSVLVPVLTYYGIGYIQFGFRYALDFLPFLLILAALNFPRPISALARSLVLVSVLITIWGSIFLMLWI